MTTTHTDAHKLAHHRSSRPTPLWVRILRTSLLGLLLSAVVAGTLYLHTHTFPELLQEITDTEAHPAFPTSATTAVTWIMDQLGYLAPFLSVLILPFIIYRKLDRHDGMAQRELACQMALVAAFTYLFLLPYVAHISDAELQAALAAGEAFPTREGGAYDTLLLRLAEWFIRLAVGLAVLLVYHTTRAQREIQDARRAATVPAAVEANEPSRKEAAAQAAQTASGGEMTEN